METTTQNITRTNRGIEDEGGYLFIYRKEKGNQQNMNERRKPQRYEELTIDRKDNRNQKAQGNDMRE